VTFVATRSVIKLFNRNIFDIITARQEQKSGQDVGMKQRMSEAARAMHNSVCEKDTEAGGRATDEERVIWTVITSCNTTVTANRFV